jgi:hypothetical protein
VVADHHPDRRVDDLGRDAVADLVGDACGGVPARPVDVAEEDTRLGQLLGRLAGCRDEPDGDRVLHPRHHEEVATLVIGDHVRRLIPVCRIDVRAVAVGRFGDVRIGADDRVLERHGDPLVVVVANTVRRRAATAPIGGRMAR